MEQYLTQFKQALVGAFGAGQSTGLFNKYQVAFSEEYFDAYSLNDVIEDVKRIEMLTTDNMYGIHIYNETRSEGNIWQIKLLKLQDKVSLSRGLPIIENFGFKLLDEHPYQINLGANSVVHICDFGVEVPSELFNEIDNKETIENLKSAIITVFDRKVESDGLNKLVLHSGLDVRQVSLIRSVVHYLIQTSIPYSKQYVSDCLRKYPKLVRKFFKLFDAKLNPKTHSDITVALTRSAIADLLSTVTSLDEDRILKAFIAVIEAMLRTNYYQLNDDGTHKEMISFKIESGKLSFLPKPRPLYEIFVYSIRFEAIHLRGGKVARGGIRWSDRKEDFRTEVLGLVKAQIVKNSVIVPTGSKGGFICKKLPDYNNREAYMAEGIKCYKSFIASLLDITDNLVAGKIIYPKDVVRLDGDDPYLVVAADKGTSTFSDYANEISLARGFWLGDAFASGGSAGYDHKKMGITAKGAWESVKRHFRHLGVDTQNQTFSVIGVGDLMGDVFGNGMLLSKHIELLAAFNHMHIFLDPNPDPEKSFAERERMFNLPSSTWADYDISKISTGGGIYSRTLKSISLTPEVKFWLNIDATELSPTDLIFAMLRAKADMLYNGGIGTYIKAESESNEDVKDKANDAVRVNGSELQVKVVIEGGNLGATQLGRIEFAKHGGAIYTDAIDNSAGVDCSDHEVNIKILFAAIMQKTGMTTEERNKILVNMTSEIGHLVLRDNYLQTQLLQYASARAVELFSLNMYFIAKLEKCGELDRKVEFLPNAQEVELRGRMGIGLTTPELAVLLAYAKMRLNNEILTSDLVNDTQFEQLLVNYFPHTMQQGYLSEIKQHYLKKEIIANQLANTVINHMGITFVSRFQDEFRVNTATIIRAWWAVYKLVDAEKVFALIESLDNKVSADMQIIMQIRFKKTLERMTRWTLRTVKQDQVIKELPQYQSELIGLIDNFDDLINAKDYAEVAEHEVTFISSGVPIKLAKIIARTNYIPQLLDIILLSKEYGRELSSVAHNYFYAGRELRIDWLRRNLIALPENNKWQSLSRSALLADGYVVYSNILKSAFTTTSATDSNFLKTWLDKQPEKIVQINTMFDELQTYKQMDLAMLSAVVRELGNILA